MIGTSGATPPPGGWPPNNWRSNFGGDAWQLDPATGQYYYDAFLQQPDLNWRNPEVQLAMLDVLRFWLDRGVDGSRVAKFPSAVKPQQSKILLSTHLDRHQESIKDAVELRANEGVIIELT